MRLTLNGPLQAMHAIAAIATGSGERLFGMFRSTNLGANWTQMALPGKVEANGFHGIHPGGQASTNFSIAADPAKSTVVYVGGDTQATLPS